jgi:AI-2 transport protein TqsA
MLGGSQQFASALQNAASYAATALNMVWQTAASLVLILFLVLLMLIERPSWRAKLAAVDRENRTWERSASIAGKQFQRYFLTRLVLGTVTALLYMGWLALFGIDFILVWGLLALLLNFIPTVGSLIAGIFPVLFAFARKDPGTALLVGGGLLVIEQVIGNFVDPKLLGKRLSISPLVILVSLLVWSGIWGIAGALIAVPMTVLLTVAFAEVPALRPVALFLSNERDLEGLEEHVAEERSSPS